MFGEYSVELRIVWNPSDGYYVQSYAVYGVDGPFDHDDLLRMQTLRRECADTLADALGLAVDDVAAAMAETFALNGVQPRLL